MFGFLLKLDDVMDNEVQRNRGKKSILSVYIEVLFNLRIWSLCALSRSGQL